MRKPQIVLVDYCNHLISGEASELAETPNFTRGLITA